MIIAETPTAYQFITQPAHARLAGAMAEAWGGSEFDRPTPAGSVVAAAETHDDGWWPFDQRPRLGDDATPLNFTELPPSAWIPLYDRGIEAAVDLDRYAGLLVSMHGTGLRRRRYGLSPSWPDTPDGFADFVTRHEARQRALLEDLLTDGRATENDGELLEALHETGTPPRGTESLLWTNYVLLQAWDSLSLALCRSVTPPAQASISPVPRRPGGPTATLSLDRTAAGAISVDPYPFDVAPLRVRATERTVPKSAFESGTDVTAAYYGADRQPLELSLEPPT